MPRLNFGAFLAPHHPVGEHPMLQSAAISTSSSISTGSAMTNSGAASTIRAAGR